MATTALGRLTLDLAVQMSEFTDGLSRAQRETKEATENMSESASKFKDNLTESLSGTPIGAAVDSLTSKLGDIKLAFGDAGLAGATVIAGAAAAGAIVAVGVAVTAMIVEVAQADRQLELLAKRADVSTTQLQVLTAASKIYGLEMENVADILSDAKEKLGEFSATGGGGFKDTLDLIKESTGKTDAEINKMVDTVMSLNTTDGIAYMYEEMRKAGLTTEESRFLLEGWASGLGDIEAVYEQNGNKLKSLEKDLEQYGVIRTEEAIANTRLLSEESAELSLVMEGYRNELVTQSTPALIGFIEYLTKGANKAGDMKGEIGLLGKSMSGLSVFAIGAISMFKSLGYAALSVGGIIGSFAALVFDLGTFNAIGAYDRFVSRNEYFSGFADEVVKEMDRANAAIDTAKMTPKQLADRDSAYKMTDKEKMRRGLPVDGLSSATGSRSKYESDSEKEANKARDNNTKALNANTKSKGASASKDPSKYIQYANKGASRNEKLTSTLEQKLSFLEELGVTFKVGSGGQSSTSRGKVGSTAHNGGNAGDGKFIKDGKALNINSAGDRKLLEYIISQASARGINGIGAGNNYMGAETFHLGIQKNAATWGKDGKSANALGWVSAAANKGRKNPVASNSFEKQMNTDASKAEADRLKQDEEARRLEAAKKLAGQNIYDATLAQSAKIDLQASKDAAEAARTLNDRPKDLVTVLANIERDRINAHKELDAKVMKPFLTREDEINLDYDNRVYEAISAYGEGTEGAIKASENALIERDRRIAELREATLAPLRSEREQLASDLANDIKAAEDTHGINSDTANQAKQILTDRYNIKIKELEYLAGETQRQIDMLSQNIGVSTRQSTDQLGDMRAKESMKPEEYEQYSANKSWERGRSEQQGAYKSREDEINGLDSKGDFLYQEDDRNKLLEEAHEEHLSRMALLDEEYALTTTGIAKTSAMSKLEMEQTNVEAFGSLAGALLGQQSTAARAAFLISKGYTVQKILLDKGAAMSSAYANAEGDVWAKSLAAAKAGIENGLFSDMITQVALPTFSGVAHGGMDYIPSESTFLLDKGERVLSPRQNKDLTSFLANGSTGSGSGDTNISITIDNNGNANMDSDNAATVSKQMALQVKNLVQATLRQEKKQGGML